MSKYKFICNSGEQLTLGTATNAIKVNIWDDTPAPTPVSLAIAYTVDLFRRYGLDHAPSYEEYVKIPEAICQRSLLHWFSSVWEFCNQVYRQVKPGDGTGLTELGKKVVVSMRATK